MARSEASRERERRRARGAPKLIGRRRESGGCSTGHPAMWNMTPALELGVMPEGGGYPLGFVEAAVRLMGCRDVAEILHLCSGSIDAPWTVDARPETRPRICADVRWLPLRASCVRWILADPPYGADYAEALWQMGKIYPTPTTLLREAAHALVPGGRVGLLHQVVPVLPDGLSRVGTFGVSTGPGYRMRAFTIAERTPDSVALW